MSDQKYFSNCEDLKTDSVPEAPRDVIDDQEDQSLSLAFRQVSVIEESHTDTERDEKTYLQQPEETSLKEQKQTSSTGDRKQHLEPPEEQYSTPKKKSSPRSIPKSPKNRREKQKSPEPTNIVYKISHSNGIRIGTDYNVTIVQNSSTSKADSTPKKTKTISGLLSNQTPVNRNHIQVVAPHVGENWRDVGRTLDLTDGQLTQIKMDFKEESMKEVVYQMILAWTRANASEAKLCDLTSALWNSQEYCAVKKLAEWSKQQAQDK